LARKISLLRDLQVKLRQVTKMSSGNRSGFVTANLKVRRLDDDDDDDDDDDNGDEDVNNSSFINFNPVYQAQA